MALRKRASSKVSVPRAMGRLGLGASTREDGTTANRLDMMGVEFNMSSMDVRIRIQPANLE